MTEELKTARPCRLTDPEGVYLLLDAALPRVYAGLLRGGEWLALESSAEPAAEGLFDAVERGLNRAAITLEGVAGYLFCEGPGSILGMRIASMAIRTWRGYHPGRPVPCLAYRNLELLGTALLESGRTPPFGVLSDARRGHWNFLEINGKGDPAPLRRVPDEQVETAVIPLWRPDEAPIARPPARDVSSIPYDLAPAAPWFYRHPLLRTVAEPEPLVLGAPEYRKWPGRL